jgi:ribonuclease G
MERESHRDRVYTALADALKRDRVKTNILKISDLGLVEMTRKRVRPSLLRTLSEPCFYCGGSGFLKNRTTIAYEIYRSVVRDAELVQESVVRLSVHRLVAEVLADEERSMMEELEARIGKRLLVEAVEGFHVEHFEVCGCDSADGALAAPDADGRSAER